MKITCFFRQNSENGPFTLSKEIELACVPLHNSWFEYEDGWAMAQMNDRLSIEITKDTIAISGYGLPFSEDEIELLLNSGWNKE